MGEREKEQEELEEHEKELATVDIWVIRPEESVKQSGAERRKTQNRWK